MSEYKIELAAVNRWSRCWNNNAEGSSVSNDLNNAIPASRSDENYTARMRRHSKMGKGFLWAALILTVLSMIFSEAFWVFPCPFSNSTTVYVHHPQRWVEWKVYVCLMILVFLSGLVAIKMLWRVDQPDWPALIVLCGLLCFCSLVSFVSAAIFASIWWSNKPYGQKVPMSWTQYKTVLTNGSGVVAGGIWWKEYFRGEFNSSDNFHRTNTDSWTARYLISFLCSLLCSIFYIPACLLNFNARE